MCRQRFIAALYSVGYMRHIVDKVFTAAIVLLGVAGCTIWVGALVSLFIA